MTILRADDLAPSDLLHLLGELTFPAQEKVRCWLDAPDGWALDYWPGPAGRVRWNGAGRDTTDEPLAALLPRVTQGRIFAPSGELRWRLLPALGDRCCRVMFLGAGWAGAALEGLPVRQELAGLSRDQETYPMWGQQTSHTPGEWIDLRIPHRLRYPVDAAAPERGRVIAQVTVEIWKDGRGEPQFVRLCELTAKQEK
jgi:hypothetical protein